MSAERHRRNCPAQRLRPPGDLGVIPLPIASFNAGIAFSPVHSTLAASSRAWKFPVPSRCDRLGDDNTSSGVGVAAASCVAGGWKFISLTLATPTVIRKSTRTVKSGNHGRPFRVGDGLDRTPRHERKMRADDFMRQSRAARTLQQLTWHSSRLTSSIRTNPASSVTAFAAPHADASRYASTTGNPFSVTRRAARPQMHLRPIGFTETFTGRADLQDPLSLPSHAGSLASLRHNKPATRGARPPSPANNAASLFRFRPTVPASSSRFNFTALNPSNANAP